MSAEEKNTAIEQTADANRVDAGMGSAEPVLSVRNLRVMYETPRGDIRAVDGIDIDLNPGETLGLVGESGCGKSTAVMGILRLVAPPGRIVSGEVWLDGEDLMSLDDSEIRTRRWTRMSLIPQGAMNSLNPTMRVGAQIADVMVTHKGRIPKRQLVSRIEELLQMVGLSGKVRDMYPHQLSGGMKQRACIAMAVALNPRVVIADEATSALDVVVQRVVAQTLARVRDSLGVSMIMIGHDMGLIAQMADRVAVMYAGRVVEVAKVEHLFRHPAHPYSKMLIESVPTLTDRKPLRVASGLTHDPRNPPSGCIFRLRCPLAIDECSQERPPFREIRPGQDVACIRAEIAVEGADA